MDPFEEPQSDALASIAEETGFSPDAVATMARAMAAGHGRMAQFAHPEFGGAGQWMAGGMLMTPDWSDHALHARVARLCDALAALPPPAEGFASQHQSQSQLSGGLSVDASASEAGPGGDWWPASLGVPDTSGAQDGLRYAWFADARRLVIDDDGRVTAYDTGDHRIHGVAQQQGDRRSLSFTSQDGDVDVASLPLAHGDRPDAVPHRSPSVDAAHVPQRSPGVAPPLADPFVALERLADLHARGVVDAAEFAAKKAELLGRI